MQKNLEKSKFFVDVLKATAKMSRIQIRSQIRIRIRNLKNGSKNSIRIKISRIQNTDLRIYHELGDNLCQNRNEGFGLVL